MIEFYKMSGSGNDFILIDNRKDVVGTDDPAGFARKVCERKISIGADGLILIEESRKADFRWQFFNADGSRADMCGNGGRCAARFAYVKGIAHAKMSFETGAGIIDAEVRDGLVKLRLTDPGGLKVGYSIRVYGRAYSVNSIDTGVPHVVSYPADLDSCDVVKYGREIRFHAQYQPAGTNVNFACVIDPHSIRVRTYERGVEDETLACGTGAVASALISAWKNLVRSPVDVRVKSGEILRVYFEKTEKGFRDVYLEGGARIVYQGFLWDE
ncbi:MAG: diaminopimelate epimerase [Syntrophales bacterium]